MLIYGTLALAGFILVSAYTLVKTFLNKKYMKDYFECPDKLEPKSKYLPKSSLKKIRKKLGFEDDI